MPFDDYELDRLARNRNRLGERRSELNRELQRARDEKNNVFSRNFAHINSIKDDIYNLRREIDDAFQRSRDAWDAHDGEDAKYWSEHGRGLKDRLNDLYEEKQQLHDEINDIKERYSELADAYAEVKKDHEDAKEAFNDHLNELKVEAEREREERRREREARHQRNHDGDKFIEDHKFATGSKISGSPGSWWDSNKGKGRQSTERNPDGTVTHYAHRDGRVQGWQYDPKTGKSTRIDKPET